ncbi:MAG: hypothetical protein ACKPCM_16290 [Pseudanabaena sp.]
MLDAVLWQCLSQRYKDLIAQLANMPTTISTEKHNIKQIFLLGMLWILIPFCIYLLSHIVHPDWYNTESRKCANTFVI